MDNRSSLGDHQVMELTTLELAVLELLMSDQFGQGILPYAAGEGVLKERGYQVNLPLVDAISSPYCQAVLSLEERGLVDLSQVHAGVNLAGTNTMPLLQAYAEDRPADRIGGPFLLLPGMEQEALRLLGEARPTLGPRSRLSPLAS